MSDLKPTERFSNRVDDYVKYRPSYPEAVIDTLIERCGLSFDSAVADVGSGTGIFTRLLTPAVGRVIAVEPNASMRAVAESLAGVESVDGTSESMPIDSDSIDLITAAQAFHWFDRGPTKAEFQRVLKAGGWVALIWNERQSEGSTFLVEYDVLLNRFCPDYQAANHRNVGEAGIAEFMRPYKVEKFEYESFQDFDLESLQGRSLSSSYAPARGSQEAEAFLAELVALFERTAVNGQVRFKYQTQLFLSQWYEPRRD